jgi:hypothetical protein
MKNVNPDPYSFLTGTVKYFGSAQEKNNSGFEIVLSSYPLHFSYNWYSHKEGGLIFCVCSCFLHRSVYSDELLVRRWTNLAVGSTTSALPTFYSNRKASIRLTFDNGNLTRRTLIGSIKIELFCQQKSLINGISYRSVETIRRRLQSKIF